MLRARLSRGAFAIVPILLLATCTASEDCAAGNPLMPVCFDPSPSEPRMLVLRFPDSTWSRSDLYTMNSDGTNARGLTTHGKANLPVWSPEGERIAFARGADDSDIRAQIYVVSADGSTLQNLSNQTTAFDYSPTWSPDGRRIAFQSDRHKPATTSCCATSIYVMNTDGSNVTRLTTVGNDWYPRWSPDGSAIAFSSNRGGSWQLFVMNADGSNVRQLTTDGMNFRPVWSPDGMRIAFEGYRSGSMGGMGDGIYVMNADGSRQMNVSQATAMDMGPTWSSDGRQILFGSNRASNGKMHVYTVGMDGGDVRLVSDSNTEDCYPDFKLPRRPGGAATSR